VIPDSVARVLRTLIQLLAAGGFTALFEQIARDVPPGYTPYILILATLLVTAAQNGLEQAGVIPAFLRPVGTRNETV
jgi:hypothetical protein